jgi:transposase
MQPYCPDLNLVEIIWAIAEENVTSQNVALKWIAVDTVN